MPRQRRSRGPTERARTSLCGAFSALTTLVVVCAGCRVALPAHLGVNIPGMKVSVAASARADVRVEAAVPLQGATVVEFFGVPLDGAQDIVFVLDHSGSMNEPAKGRLAHVRVSGSRARGTSRKIAVAREELADALERLPVGTRVNVLLFNRGLEAFAPTLVRLTASNRDQLVAFARAMDAGGATALAPAMRTALLMNPRRVVLLSDGIGNVGGGPRAVLRDAREAMRGGVRIDTVGLGKDQDAALLRELARESGGLYQAL